MAVIHKEEAINDMSKTLTQREYANIQRDNKNCTCQNNGDYCETCNELIEAAEEQHDSIEQVYLNRGPAYYMRHYRKHSER
jgi:methionyl-tRNA synthetase